MMCNPIKYLLAISHVHMTLQQRLPYDPAILAGQQDSWILAHSCASGNILSFDKAPQSCSWFGENLQGPESSLPEAYSAFAQGTSLLKNRMCGISGSSIMRSITVVQGCLGGSTVSLSGSVLAHTNLNLACSQPHLQDYHLAQRTTCGRAMSLVRAKASQFWAG